jgi:hypothetical protein
MVTPFRGLTDSAALEPRATPWAGECDPIGVCGRLKALKVNVNRKSGVKK